MVRYRAWWWLDNGGVIEVGIDGESPDVVKQFLRENFRGRGHLKIYEWEARKRLVFEGAFHSGKTG